MPITTTRLTPLLAARISRDGSPYISLHGRGGLLHSSGNSSVQRARSDRFRDIYRTMQFDNAVQDTERSTSLCNPVAGAFPK